MLWQLLPLERRHACHDTIPAQLGAVSASRTDLLVRDPQDSCHQAGLFWWYLFILADPAHLLRRGYWTPWARAPRASIVTHCKMSSTMRQWREKRKENRRSKIRFQGKVNIKAKKRRARKRSLTSWNERQWPFTKNELFRHGVLSAAKNLLCHGKLVFLHLRIYLPWKYCEFFTTGEWTNTKARFCIIFGYFGFSERCAKIPSRVS